MDWSSCRSSWEMALWPSGLTTRHERTTIFTHGWSRIKGTEGEACSPYLYDDCGQIEWREIDLLTEPPIK